MLDDLLNMEGIEKEPELPMPSLEQQKKIVAQLKALEEKGELTPEILEAFITGTHPSLQEDKA